MARDPVARPSPHPASAVAEVDGRSFCSSVLPWRSSGGAVPWRGASQAERTEVACRDLASADIDVWGGDWNHALEGRDWAGSRGGRAAIVDTLDRLGLVCITSPLPAAGDLQRTVDHVAVRRSIEVDCVERVVAADDRGRLSDHDAYVATLRFPLGGPT